MPDRQHWIHRHCTPAAAARPCTEVCHSRLYLNNLSKTMSYTERRSNMGTGWADGTAMFSSVCGVVPPQYATGGSLAHAQRNAVIENVDHQLPLNRLPQELLDLSLLTLKKLRSLLMTSYLSLMISSVASTFSPIFWMILPCLWNFSS